MATLASEVIAGAYRYSRVVRRPLTGLSNSEQIEGLELLNSLIDQWSGEELTVIYRQRIVFPINANQQTYIIGLDVSGGVPDYLIKRPVRIDRAGYIFTNTAPPLIEQPYEMYTEQDWASLSPKGLTSTIATIFYYEASVPNGKINLWPIPTMASQQALYLWNNLQEVSGIDVELELPPAFRIALETNLSILISLRYGMPANPMLINQAKATKAVIKNNSWEPLVMQAESASMGMAGRDGTGRYSILSNTFIR